MPLLDEEKLTAGLNPAQREAVFHVNGPLLVLAGAGSGKTETMAARVAWLVANRVVEPEAILGLTFTRKAASELNERVRLRLGALAKHPDTEAELRGKLELALPTVSTYHGYAASLVAEHGLRIGIEPGAGVLGPAMCWGQAAAVVGSWTGDMTDVPLSLLTTALGGGTSSRLFQEVRERRGLAYAVYAFASSYSDAGVVGVGAGCLPGKVDDVLAVAREELARIARDGITEEELARSQGQLRGGLVLGLEDTGSRMARLGESELFQERLRGLDEVLERIDEVTLAEVHALARELLTGPQTLALVGPA